MRRRAQSEGQGGGGLGRGARADTLCCCRESGELRARATPRTAVSCSSVRSSRKSDTVRSPAAVSASSSMLLVLADASTCEQGGSGQAAGGGGGGGRRARGAAREALRQAHMQRVLEKRACQELLPHKRLRLRALRWCELASNI